ncbi:Ankyrin repeats (3 copies) [Popillia japonica]|uniref:Ankyrin repeats (3 copies) n=1 Tax=Popillia japonica TaxID=7064 RepID=A0AAW1HS40_POPJA
MHRHDRSRYRRISRLRGMRGFEELSSPNSDDEFLFNESHFWITYELFKDIGRSSICILREYYLDLVTTRGRDQKEIYSTPLHVASALKKQLLAVQDLLKCPDLERNARNTFGETSVLLCLKENVAENIINILLDYDCDCTTACFKGITPVHIAALNNRENLLIKFLERGADVNATSDIGVTPLHLAILASNYEIVRRLLEYNANPNLATSLKFTPLMFALSFQDIDIRICDLLCSLDIHAGTTLANPLYCAIKSQHPFVERNIMQILT